MTTEISIEREIVEKAYLVAEEVLQDLCLSPGTYDAKEIHTILYYEHPRYVSDNNFDMNVEKCTIEHSLGQYSLPKMNVFHLISKLEPKVRLGGKKRKIWTINEPRSCQFEFDITMPNKKQMKDWSSDTKKLTRGNRYMIFSLRDEALYHISNDLTAKISNRDLAGTKTDLHPDIYFKFSWLDLRKIYGKCKIQLYYDRIEENSYKKVRVIITNEDGLMTSSNCLLSPKEVETLKPYKKSLSRPYSENRKVQEDISEDTTCSEENATSIAKPHINEETTINYNVAKTDYMFRASATAVPQDAKDNRKLNAYARLKANIEKADKIYIIPLNPVQFNKPFDSKVSDAHYWLGLISTLNLGKATGKNIHTFVDETKPVHQAHQHHMIIGKTPKDWIRILCKLFPLRKEGVDIILKKCVSLPLAKGIITGTLEIKSIPNNAFRDASKQETSS